MVVINISQENTFLDALKSNDLVVVHFYADWAAQCGPMNEVLEELDKQTDLKGVKFAKCVAEDFPELSMKYNVTAVPTFLLLRGGSLVDRVDGANAPDLTKKITSEISKFVNNPVPAPEPKPGSEDLNNRLHQLINAAPVMLFMKGTAVEPKCGFSRTIVGLLDELNADYKTFNILNDEEVRQGLKTYSNWPTYPQLYINGELIGGLDIVKEMHNSGELQPLLPKKLTLEERLKELINKSECMIFMKGNRITFETFDILTNEEVRQGLKTFSNWPTYPQVYVKGELVGGLDIIKELKESGDLLSTLKGQSQ
ncbi:Glutaredoxin-3 [Blattella germanica]|nr:Glutaredoxin-3 [Blattella germanica]